MPVLRFLARAILPVLALVAGAGNSLAAQAPARDHNVVLIITDGFRWQELFNGADSTLLTREHGGVEDTLGLRTQFWRPTPEARRETLLPFLWGTIGKQGQIFGNQAKGSVAQITNTFKFSYPGYNEILTGRFDPRIDSNEYPPNPNVTVFEWLSNRSGFEGKVAAFGTWDAFPRIFNRDRATKLFLRAEWERPFDTPRSDVERLLNQQYATVTREWGTYMGLDGLMAPVVREYVKRHQPRALYLGYGETDEFAHDKRYDRMLASAHAVDYFIGDLWRTMQAMPQYKGKTTFIISTDHGRGNGARWTDHGADVDGAENIWLAMIGPGIAPLGERTNVGKVTQSQIAATLARAVGEDYAGMVEGVGQPIPPK
jgi:hypothetical protein